MSWLARLTGKSTGLSPTQSARLAAIKSRTRADVNTSLDQARCVVVDVETSGLDVAHDRLIAIGAVAVCGARVCLSDSLDIVLRQAVSSSRDNILIHGIGGQAQSQGLDPVDALLSFLEFVGGDPLIAFHVTFDQTMICNALRDRLHFRFDNHWADVAHIAPALYPDLAARNQSLDQWMSAFSIRNFARHSALGDALATAELLLALGTRLKQRQIHTFRALRDLAEARARAGG